MSGAVAAAHYDFRGHPVRRLAHRGAVAFIAREVGAALGYEDQGKQFVRDLTTEWAAKGIKEGAHWARLRGEDLRQIKAQAKVGGEIPPTSFDLTYVPELVILTEEGLNLSLMESRRPLALEFRLWLAADVVPEIARTGKYDPAPAAVAPPVPPTANLGPRTVTVVRSGLLLAGTDCHLGTDQERYLTKPGILCALEGTPRRHHAQLVTGLPNAFDGLACGDEIELIIPQPHGGFAHVVGYPARHLIDFCKGQIAALGAGSLPAALVPSAMRCAALAIFFAERGIETMIDEACGVVVRVEGNATPARMAPADVNAIVAGLGALLEGQFTRQVDYFMRHLGAELGVGLKPTIDVSNGMMLLLQHLERTRPDYVPPEPSEPRLASARPTVKRAEVVQNLARKAAEGVASPPPKRPRLTYEQIANEAGVNPRTVSNRISGQPGHPAIHARIDRVIRAHGREDLIPPTPSVGAEPELHEAADAAPPPLAGPPPALPWQKQREIAKLAQVTTKTVRRRLAGKPGRPVGYARIDKVLRDLGLAAYIPAADPAAG